jgi:cellulose synthase (UDP-forming)
MPPGEKSQRAARPRPLTTDRLVEVPRLYVLERLRGRQTFRSVLAVIYLVTAVVYLAWRATVFNPNAPVFSLMFYLAEVVGFILAAFMIALSWRYRVRDTMPAPEGLSVDVLIPTYNESAEMIRRTVLAAMQIGYRHETWLLDDGNRAEIRAIATELGCHYLARSNNLHAKPGNLNNALKHARGDFIAVMDADFVAQRNFLDRTLGYFAEPDVAFVQCPQDYYNIRAFQYRVGGKDRFLWHDEAPFYYVLQPGRDYWNATSSCGTSVVYRRSALDAIGGFAPETVTEDMHTALRLHIAGFESAYHPEPLAFGVAPTDFAEYQKTRHRWGQGNVQGLRCEHMPFAPRLSLMQRICYMQFGIMYLEGWQRLIFYITPAVALIGGIYPVTTTPSFFWFFIPYLLLDYLCYEEITRGYGRVYLNEQLCMSRFPIYILSSFAVFFNYVRWRVSSKNIAGSLPIWLVLPQVGVLALNLTAIGFGIWRIGFDPAPSVPRWIMGVVCLFALTYGVIAAAVIWHARRCALYKRPDFRFDVQIPLVIETGDGKRRYGIARRTSAVGMTFTVTDEFHAPADGRVRGKLYLPNGVVPFEADIDDAEQDVLPDEAGASLSVLFRWQGNAADRLELALHICGWHRRFSYRGDHLMTPLEWLQSKLTKAPVHQMPEWETVIVAPVNADDSESFALWCGREGGPHWIAAYTEFATGTILTVINPRRPGEISHATVLGHGELPTDAEIELQGAVPLIHSVQWEAGALQFPALAAAE